jgi:hypothetical protein
MTLLDSPDVYGFTVFCDDIRHEINGTRSLIGTYAGTLTVHDVFPVTLPKFGFAVTFLQRKNVFIPNVELRIFLPGDDDENASIRATFSEANPGQIAADLAAKSPSKDDEKSYSAMHSFLIFTPLNLPMPGEMKVRAVVGENMYRIGALRISQGATASAPPQ